MTPYKLYGRQGSGSFAVQVALEEIGVPYECIWIAKEASEVETFRKINPTGRVPALALPDGTLMFESAAILIHLSLAHPEAKLAPEPGTSQHALFLQWMTFLSANAYEAVLRIYYSARYSTRGEGDAEPIREQATQEFLGHLDLISQSLRPYVLGTRYTIADVYLYMLSTWFPAGTAELYARLPSLGAHAQLLALRPAVSKVETDHAV
ncbi:MAG TPA: glutathione S-transferase family protein [Steroidobacteraceae bacterium]|nr:glutathione S-transferase family protein [Steroidobacteraceae bacterium]